MTAAVAIGIDARRWGLHIAANVMIALAYGLIGVLPGPLFGRVGGVFITFDETGPLLIALAWLTGLPLAAGILFRRSATALR